MNATRYDALPAARARAVPTRCACSPSTRVEAAKQPATRACRWAWPRSPRRCGAAICSTTRPTRTGRTATASCSPTATARCCCTRCCTSRGYALPIEELRRFRQLHSKTPGHPEVGVTPGRRDDHRAARAGARQRRRHGARRAAAGGGVQSPRAHDRRPPHLGVRGRRLPDGGHQPRGRLARRHARAREADRHLRRQRHQHRRRVEHWFARRHARALCAPTAGA